jgi:hypothetical protein
MQIRPPSQNFEEAL